MYMSFIVILVIINKTLHEIELVYASPRPMSRERERRTSTRLHRGIPTTTDLQREVTRMSMGQTQPSSIMSGLAPGIVGRREGGSREDVPRSGSSKHVGYNK
ncbi:hypothetical protein Btru_074205 [Bulinus truncatus]|nr:hypothetical protein Btru_074205 [Bulinus truncatus]